ncbi:uncharacterized protein LOC110226160 [Arabidopsis lyrata subsp. lyrata]|uniref:uncharacterized protein LOC110226160 n=1 Tax=Arabidopsis lyrata subsp. lyrata TaxID=81972 RepID=UPI000A29B167|nr:uncharacterized protein LOC110226160 [Arabidopsis lyrata subsp. lyrata]|eukprot:XP_020872492.1 uncharacterized protein LOC110226160 [Arabidopsis lyrata subsp. lyrata]
MVHITPRSINNYMDFIDYDEIKYAGTQEKEHVTGQTDYEARHVMFKIKDNDGKKMICVAVGESCELFVNKLSTRLSSPRYNNDPIVAVMRFWRISEIKGA